MIKQKYYDLEIIINYHETDNQDDNKKSIKQKMITIQFVVTKLKYIYIYIFTYAPMQWRPLPRLCLALVAATLQWMAAQKDWNFLWQLRSGAKLGRDGAADQESGPEAVAAVYDVEILHRTEGRYFRQHRDPRSTDQMFSMFASPI